jgi:hypothetical protein
MSTPENHLARAHSFLGAATVLRDIEARTHNGVRRAFSDQFVRTGAIEDDWDAGLVGPNNSAPWQTMILMRWQIQMK